MTGEAPRGEGGGGRRKGEGGSGAFLKFAETASQILSLDLNLATQHCAHHLNLPPSHDCANPKLHVCVASSPSVNTLARPGPDGTELTQK